MASCRRKDSRGGRYHPQRRIANADRSSMSASSFCSKRGVGAAFYHMIRGVFQARADGVGGRRGTMPNSVDIASFVALIPLSR